MPNKELIEEVAGIFAKAIYNKPLNKVYLLDVNGRAECCKYAHEAIPIIAQDELKRICKVLVSAGYVEDSSEFLDAMIVGDDNPSGENT